MICALKKYPNLVGFCLFFFLMWKTHRIFEKFPVFIMGNELLSMEYHNGYEVSVHIHTQSLCSN